MKTKYTLFNILFTVALLGLLAAIALPRYAQAQTTHPGDIVTDPNVKQAFITFLQDVSTQKSVTLAIYPTYAPNIKVDGKDENWGGGIALLTPVTVIPGLEDITLAKHAYAGVRLDLIGRQFFASTVAVGLKYDVQIAGHNVTFHTETGANIPLAGSDETNVGVMGGGGLSTAIFSFGKKNADGVRPGIFGAFLNVEKWSQFDGIVGHGGFTGTYRF